MFLKRFSVGKQPVIQPIQFSMESSFNTVNDDTISLSKTVNGKINKGVQDANDILIFGTICEAACKVSTPVEILTQNKNMFDHLVKQGIDSHSDKYEGYEFKLDRVNALLSETETCSNDSSDTFSFKTKSLVLIGKSKDKSIDCEAILRINHSQISIICDDTKEERIIVPTSIVNAKPFSELNYIYNALIWILLAKAEFYLDSDGYFFRPGPKSKSYFLSELLFGCTIFNPYQVIKVFNDK